MGEHLPAPLRRYRHPRRRGGAPRRLDRRRSGPQGRIRRPARQPQKRLRGPRRSRARKVLLPGDVDSPERRDDDGQPSRHARRPHAARRHRLGAGRRQELRGREVQHPPDDEGLRPGHRQGGADTDDGEFHRQRAPRNVGRAAAAALRPFQGQRSGAGRLRVRKHLLHQLRKALRLVRTAPHGRGDPLRPDGGDGQFGQLAAFRRETQTG